MAVPTDDRETLEVMDTVRIRKRSYLSTQHLVAAKLFAKHAREIEAKVAAGEAPQFIDEVRQDYRSFVIGAVLAAVAFLEARINEFLHGLGEGDFDHLDPQVISTAVKFLDRGLERRARLTTLEKYELVLDLFARPAFDRGRAPYQDVECLIQLRNALIHYQPEWVLAGVTSTPQDEQHEIERALRGRFQESPLDPPGNPFYPDRCISGACAEWASEQSFALVAEFLARLGIDSSTLPISSSRQDTPAS